MVRWDDRTTDAPSIDIAMKPTTAHAIKNAVHRKLHPQLPLDRRQSQQLLELISSSFRQKLDQEHASTPTDTRPIDRHIQSILSNPLFQPPPTANAHRVRAPSTHLSEQLAAVASPVAFFNQQAALGKVTLKIAAHVLMAADNKSHRSHSPSEADVREAHDSVTAVLNWLWASGLEDSLEFLGDRPFTVAMGRSLASTGRDDVFWRWFTRLHGRVATDGDGDQLAATAHDRDRIMLLARPFLRRKFDRAGSADDAARDLLAVTDHHVPGRQLRRSLLRATSGWFTWQLLRRPEGEVLDAALADRITRHTALTGAMSEASRAIIDLFLPTPDASRAAAYLGRELIWLTQRDASAAARWHRILFSLRTINALLDQNRQPDAERIVAILRTYYPHEIRSQLPQRIAPAAAASIQARWDDLLSTRSDRFSPQLE